MLGNNILIGAAGAGGATGHIIEGSGLFDGAGDLVRTPSTDTNNQLFSIDIIFKRTKLGETLALFSAGTGASAEFRVFIDTSDNLQVEHVGGSGTFDYTTTQVFRDPAAYNNLRIDVDMSQAAADRVILKLQGTRVTDFISANNPSSAFDTFVNTTNPHYIGVRADGSTNQGKFYISRFLLSDGNTAADTGEVTDDGFWQINDASELTFGNNGFLLTGGSAISAGTDSSSNASTTAVDVTSAASIWDGSTGSFNLANDDIICTGGDKAIFTKTVFTGVVDLEFTGVGEWDEVLFGFSKYTTVNNAGTAAGGVDGVEGISIYEHASNATKFSDWSNTNAGNGNSPTATITRGQIAGETCNLIRQANGTVIFKIGGSTVFTGSDTYTGPIRVWLGSHGDITPPLSMTTVSITASGTAGNIFTPTGTITATNDSPTNGGDDDEYGNLPTLNVLAPTYAATTTFSNGNRTVTNTSASALTNAPFTFGVDGLGNTGIYYCEFNIDVAGNDTTYAGLAAASWAGWGGSTGSYLGYGIGSAGGGVGEGVAILQTGSSGSGNFDTWSNGNNGTPGSVTVANNDRLCAALDTATGKCWVGFFDVSGDQQYWLDNDGTERTTDVPASGSNQNHTFTAADGDIVFAVACRAFGGNNGTLTIKPHPDDWLGTPPSGAKSVSTQTLPTPDVINYEDEYYIEAGISHSNGSTTAVTLPTSVSGGAMAIIRRTDAGGEWYVVDTVRGNNKFYTWSTAGAEDTATFSDQTLSGTSLVLPSALATGTYTIKVYYVGAYFQIKAWTGTTAAQTLTWDTALDSFGYMTSRARDDGSLTGVLFHKELDTGKVLLDADTTAQTTTGAYSQDPDKTDFRVVADASSTLLNTNGKLYISYGWADSGPYKSGVYTGNGNADGPVVNVGGKPAAFIEKSHNHGGSYYQFDIAHNTGNLADQTAFMEDPTQALTTNANTFDILSTGFKSRSADAGGNTSARPYLYWAEGIQPLTDGAINQGRAK